MLASFSVIPIGLGEELKLPVSEIIRIVDESGLPYKLGAMQTTLEGKTEEVLALIQRCHQHMTTMAPRVLTHITLDDRRSSQDRLEGKVKDVEEALNKDLTHE